MGHGCSITTNPGSTVGTTQCFLNASSINNYCVKHLGAAKIFSVTVEKMFKKVMHQKVMQQKKKKKVLIVLGSIKDPMVVTGLVEATGSCSNVIVAHST